MCALNLSRNEALVGDARLAWHEVLAFAAAVAWLEADLRLLHINPACLEILAVLERQRVHRAALRAGSAAGAVGVRIVAIRARRGLERCVRDDAAET